MDAIFSQSNYSNYVPQFLKERYNRKLELKVGDKINAILSVKGDVIAMVESVECANREDVIKMIKEKVHNFYGMAKLRICNVTREWSHEEACYLRKKNKIQSMSGKLTFSISY